MRCSDNDIRFLDNNGMRMRVLVRDLETGREPLLILNGLGQSIEILLPLIAELRDRPVIAFDMPGIGLSEMAERPLSISDYAVITADILRELNVRTYDVLGLSWGGSVAQQLAHDDPEGCRKLILAVTSAGGLVSWWGSPIALSEITFPLRYINHEYGDFIGPLMYGGEAPFNPGLFRSYSRHALRPTMPGYFSQVAALCSWTSIFWLDRLTQPVLVIAGIFDALIPFPNQLVLAQNIPLAEMKVYPDGHLIPFSRRRAIACVVRDFLNRDHDHIPGNANNLPKSSLRPDCHQA